MEVKYMAQQKVLDWKELCFPSLKELAMVHKTALITNKPVYNLLQ